MKSMKFNSILSLGVTMVMAIVVAGCASSGQRSGDRVDPYQTSKGDRRASEQASMPALLEFCDETAEKLIYELSSIPEIRDAPTQVVLELGDIQNRTMGSTSSQDFELIQRRLRSKIRNSSLAREYFLVVESRQRMDREKDRVSGTQDGEVSKTTARYDPEKTYVLQGDFFKSQRADFSRYYFELKLVNIGTRQIVFDNSYLFGQVN